MKYDFYEKGDNMVAQIINTDDRFSDLRDLNIRCLITPNKKTKATMIVNAECSKENEKSKTCSGVDFYITYYQGSMDETFADSEDPEKNFFILTMHELMHVGVDGDKLFVRDHDLQDFAAIIEAYGVDWANK